MATPVKNNTDQLAKWYGGGPHYVLSETLLGGGSGANKPLTVPAVSATVPPCAAEILSVTRSTTGTYVLTFADAYYAVAAWHVSVDDINGSTPVQGYLGQFTNLGTATPLQCTLTTYASNSAADVALATPVRITIVFKKDSTGAVA